MDASGRHGIDRRLAAAGLVAAAALSGAVSLRRIIAVDFWWQIATGRLVAEHGWPTVDVFSYTAAGRPWIELRWLYCWLVYRGWDALGAEALSAMKWPLVTGALGLVTLASIGRRSAPFAGGALVLALAACSRRFFLRPELVSYVLLAGFAAILVHHRRRGGRLVWLLPVLQILWVNLQPLFVLGPIVVATMLADAAAGAAWSAPDSQAGERRRALTLALVLAACVAACLVNPYGADGAYQPFLLLDEMRGSVFKSVISELWTPFAFLETAAVRWFLALIAAAALSAAINLRRLDRFWTLLAVSQLWLAVTAVRNVPLFAIVAIPFILSNVERTFLWNRRSGRALVVSGRVTSLAAIGLAAWFSVSLVSGRYYAQRNDPNRFGLGIAERSRPDRAVDFLERADVGGNVLGTLPENSYLVWRGHRVYADPRLEVYGEELFQNYLDVQRDPAAFRAAVERYDIRTGLVGLEATAVARLFRREGWPLVYLDEVAAVFVRPDSAGGLDPIASDAELRAAVGAIRDALPAPADASWSIPPNSYLYVADFLLMMDAPELAEPFVEDAARMRPDLPDLPLRRATLRELRSDWDGVVASATEGLRYTPDDPRLLQKLGLAYYQLGRVHDAVGPLERSIDALPNNAVAWVALGDAYLTDGRVADATRVFERAVAVEPERAELYRRLARGRVQAGDIPGAVEALVTALRLEPEDPGIPRDLAILYERMGDIATARRYAEHARHLAPHDPAIRDLVERLGGGG